MCQRRSRPSSLRLTAPAAAVANAEVATLSWKLNLIISACNALGALSSTGFGRALGARAPALAGLVAAGVFGYLAAGEVEAFFSGGGSALSRDAAAGGFCGVCDSLCVDETCV